MAFNRQPIPYPAANDYGARPKAKYPTLAVVFHMAEGTNVAQYLSRDPLRGVSVHYTIERATARWKDGQVVRCMGERRISGSTNPNTLRRDNDAYFGAKHAKGALGSWHWNPNVVTITVEVAGKAKDGPTKAQRASMVALFKDIRKRYRRVVPLGHRDFQNVKACPGTTTSIKTAYKKMGGHGLKYSPTLPPPEPPDPPDPPPPPTGPDDPTLPAWQAGYHTALDDLEDWTDEARAAVPDPRAGDIL